MGENALPARGADRKRGRCDPPRLRRLDAKKAEGTRVNLLLSVSRLIDALNERVGRAIYWLILVAVLVSATRINQRSEEPRLNSSHSQISYAVFCLKKLMKVEREDDT